MRAGPEKARTVAWVILLLTLVSLLMPFGIGVFPEQHLLGIIPATKCLNLLLGGFLLLIQHQIMPTKSLLGMSLDMLVAMEILMVELVNSSLMTLSSALLKRGVKCLIGGLPQ